MGLRVAGDKTFNVVEAILCQKSAYFRNLLKLDLTTNPKNTIDLGDVSIEVMTSFMCWLYHDNMWYLNKDSFEDCPSLGELGHLIDIYIFATKYDTIGLRNACVRCFFKFAEIDETPPKEFTTETWQVLGKAFSSLPRTAKFYGPLLGWLCFNLTDKPPKFDDAAFVRMVASLPTAVLMEILKVYTDDVAFDFMEASLPNPVLIEMLRVYTQLEGRKKTCADAYEYGRAEHWLEPDESAGMSLFIPTILDRSRG